MLSSIEITFIVEAPPSASDRSVVIENRLPWKEGVSVGSRASFLGGVLAVGRWPKPTPYGGR